MKYMDTKNIIILVLLIGCLVFGYINLFRGDKLYEYKVEDLNLLKLTLEKTRDEYKDKTKKVQFYKIFNNCMTYCYIPVDQDYLIKGAERAIMIDYLEDDSEFLNNELVINIENVEISVNSINEIYPIVDSPDELESFL